MCWPGLWTSDPSASTSHCYDSRYSTTSSLISAEDTQDFVYTGLTFCQMSYIFSDFNVILKLQIQEIEPKLFFLLFWFPSPVLLFLIRRLLVKGGLKFMASLELMATSASVSRVLVCRNGASCQALALLGGWHPQYTTLPPPGEDMCVIIQLVVCIPEQCRVQTIIWITILLHIAFVKETHLQASNVDQLQSPCLHLNYKK